LVEAKVNELPKLKIQIDYSIKRKATEEIVAEGFTKHVFLNLTSNKVVRPPGFFQDALKSFFDN